MKGTNVMNFPKLVTRFLGEYLTTERKLSIHTQLAYGDAIMLLLEYARDKEKIPAEQMSFKTFTKDLVVRFLQWLIDSRNCSARTCNHRLACIHAFCRYVQYETPESLYEISRILAIRPRKETQKVVPFLSKTQLQKLLAQIDTNTIRGRRNMTVLYFIYYTGARVQEALDLRFCDLYLTTATPYARLHGKGDKYRDVPLDATCKDLLIRYFKDIEHEALIPGDQRNVFTGHSGEKLTRWCITHMLKVYSKAASADPGYNVDFHVTPHVLRHSKGMHAIESGVPIYYVKDLFGHKSVSTTEIYARASVESKRKELEKVYPELETGTLPDWHDQKDLMSWIHGLRHYVVNGEPKASKYEEKQKDAT